jgi:Holliday junction resolvase RusA-like endonuclease
VIAWVVDGTPVAQPRPRVSTRGGFARAYVPRDHPVHAYRQGMALAAKAAGLATITSPVSVTIFAVFERPKSHLTARGDLRASAPAIPRPDCDNIAKAVLDALGDFFDDSLVARLVVTKCYGPAAQTCVEVA